MIPSLASLETIQMSSERAIPPDLTGLDGADFEAEIRPLLEILAEAPSPKPAERVQALLLNRALTLLRTGARSEIDDEAYALERFLASEHGESLHHRGEQGREVYGGLAAIARLLTAAADRADAPAIESILRNHRGRGRQVLEILAEHGAAMPRAALRARLAMSESHLSHVLRELEEPDLIVRYRQGKEVMVGLGLTGHEVVDQSVLPRWIRRLVEHLQGMAEGRRQFRVAEEVTTELLEYGAPSLLAAQTIADEICNLTIIIQLCLETGLVASDFMANEISLSNEELFAGDIILVPKVDSMIDWAIIERDPHNALRFKVVPIDDQIGPGSHDYLLACGSSRKEMYVRCTISPWIDVSGIEGNLYRKGSLESRALDAIKKRQEDIGKTKFFAGFLERKRDSDLGYIEWMGCVRRAAHKFAAGTGFSLDSWSERNA